RPATSTPSPPTVTNPPSLHDALPIYAGAMRNPNQKTRIQLWLDFHLAMFELGQIFVGGIWRRQFRIGSRVQVFSRVLFEFKHGRSDEHTSELQSRFDLVCRLLL